jgi:hypothetical protein
MSTQTQQKPTIGRIVHYYDNANGLGMVYPAIISGVLYNNPEMEGECTLSLTVFTNTGIKFLSGINYSETNGIGCWGWPPRV